MALDSLASGQGRAKLDSQGLSSSRVAPEGARDHA